MNISRHIDGLDALSAIAEHQPKLYLGTDAYLASRNNTEYMRKRNWTNGLDFKQTLEMARHGWCEGAERAQKLLDRIKVPVVQDNSISTATYYDVTGSYVDVGEYVQGVPECMVDFREDRRTSRFASILVSGVVSAGLESEEAMNRGVVIAAIVDILESRGVRCDVTLVFRNDRDGGILEYTVTLKRASEPLNLDVLTFGVAHPACFRRLVFGVMEHETDEVRTLMGIYDGGGYGHVTRIPEPPDAIVFQSPRMGEDWSEGAALKKLQTVLDKVEGRTP